MKEWNQCKQLPNGQWLDTKTNLIFGNHFTYFSQPKEYSFLDTPDRFVTNPLWGKRYVERYFRKAFSECAYGKEGFFGALTSLHVKHDWTQYPIGALVRRNNEPIEGKTIMIVGAGPSATEVNWQDIETDLLWSCNHFFLNPVLKDREVNLFTIGNEVDIKNPELVKYLAKFPRSIGCFETTNRSIDQIKDFVFRWPEQSTWMHTRYRSQIGAIPRLLVLAALEKAKKVYFVGMDGLPTPKTKHAFQPGKKPLGSPTFSGAEDKFRRQFVILWDYILHYLKSETKFVNLGEDTEGNLTADISRQEFSSKNKR